MNNDLISRKALLEAYDKAHQGQPGGARKLIEEAPGVDAVPVVHRRWQECDWVEYDGHGECIHYPKMGMVCTNCRNAFKKEFITARVNYCPNCGSKMDGGKDGR